MQSNSVWGSREVSPPPVIAISKSSCQRKNRGLKAVISCGKDLLIGVVGNIISSLISQ